jgi:glycosyltransferase involved in cell wall biosynthesis
MKYIIDVTQLVHWPGRLTGIPRVVEELARRFPSTGKTTVYVSWVKELGAFCEIDFNATLAIRGNGIEYRLRTQETDASEGSPAVAVETPVEASQLSKIQATKILAKKIVRRLKLEKIPIVERVRRGRYLKMMQNYRQVTIQKDDIVFIGAGEWWDKAFIAYLEDAHAKEAKIVQVSHDLLPITAPQFSGHATESLSNYNRHIFPISSLVLSVSRATKQDIVTWLTREGLPIPPIEVFRLGEDFTKNAPVKPKSEDFVSTGLKGSDFILTVGTIEARKNHALLYYTYKLAKARGIKLPKLLIVGRRGWKTDDIYGYMTQDPDTKDLLIPLHDIADAELSWLYDNCLFTVFPSQCEGWGMPIAESITRGVPVIAGNVSSMAEIAPDFTVSFSPNSTDELLDAIIRLLDSEVLAAQKKHIRDYRPTTWDDSFDQVANFLETL